MKAVIVRRRILEDTLKDVVSSLPEFRATLRIWSSDTTVPGGREDGAVGLEWFNPAKDEHVVLSLPFGYSGNTPEMREADGDGNDHFAKVIFDGSIRENTRRSVKFFLEWVIARNIEYEKKLSQQPL
jgi:hypothetical protein